MNVILFFLSLFGSPQETPVALETFIESLNAPTVERLLESLGPEPQLDALLDSTRSVLPYDPELEPVQESAPELQERLEEITSWTQNYERERKARNHSASAEWAARQARARMELLGRRHAHVSSSLHRLASALQSQNRDALALQTSCALIDIESDVYGPRHERIARSLRGFAKRAERVGRFAASELALSHALDIQIDRHGPQSSQAADYSSHLAAILFRQSKLEASRTLYQHAVETYALLEDDVSKSVAITLGNLALVHSQAGRELDAMDCLHRALDIYRELDLMESRGGISVLLSLAGQHSGDEARDFYEEALDLARATLDPRDSTLANLLNTFGWELVESGELRRAEEMLREALEINLENYGPESRSTALNLSNLSGLLRAKGQYPEALELFQQSFEVQKRFFPPSHPALIIAWNNLGALLRHNGRREEAAEAWERGLELAHERFDGDHVDIARMTLNLGAMNRSQGRLEDALNAFQESLEMRQRLFGDDSPEAADAGTWLAWTLLNLNRPEEGLEVVQWSLDVHRKRWGNTGVLVAGDLKTLASIQLARGEKAAAFEAAAEAFSLIDTARLRVSGDEVERARFARAISHGELAALYAKCALELDRHEEAFSIFERARGRVLLDLLERNPGAEPQWAAAQAASPAEIRASLRPGERMRAFFWSDESVIAFTIEAEGVHAREIASSSKEAIDIGVQLAKFSKVLADPRSDRDQEALGQRVAQLLWPAELDAKGPWIILPDGPVHLVPFEALPLRSDESTAFVYASSGTLYRNRLAADSERSAELSILALGAPDFDRASSLKPLPATRIEVERACELVRAAGGQAHALLGTEASLAQLEEQAAGCSILHLATHGLAGTRDKPFDAALALTPSAGSKGWLTLDDLLSRWGGRLPRCDLVVLSACDTQRGMQVGDSLLALPWGFFYAGSPSVLASLWKVDDRATALLMNRFYERLLSPEAPSKLDALRQAKTWLASADRNAIRDEEKRLGLDQLENAGTRSTAVEASLDVSELKPYADPAFWAGFILLGSPD